MLAGGVNQVFIFVFCSEDDNNEKFITFFNIFPPEAFF